MERPLTVGQLARATGVPAKTIRSERASNIISKRALVACPRHRAMNKRVAATAIMCSLASKMVHTRGACYHGQTLRETQYRSPKEWL
jgi:hypothetical protein